MTEYLWTKGSSKCIEIVFKTLKRYFLIPDDAVDRRKLGFFFNFLKNERIVNLCFDVLSDTMQRWWWNHLNLETDDFCHFFFTMLLDY